MIGKIEFNGGLGQELTVQEIHKKALINLDEKLQPQPVALSIGETAWRGKMYPATFGSYGDYSCLVGASKSMKSFLKSALLASYFGGQASNYFPDIKGHHQQDKYVLDIDTEQSEYHSQRVFRRIPEMVGATPELYKGFSLRRFTPNERFEYVNYLIMESEYRGKIGLVSIDGYADLINDFNSLEEANKLSSHLLKWTAESNCHITGILHKNFGSEKPVGHIGSAVLKKAETVVFIDPDPNGSPSKLVTCQYSRNMSFDSFLFHIGPDHLPIVDSEGNIF